MNNTIVTLTDDISSTNGIRQFRRVGGINQRAVNPYSWWQAAVVMLSFKGEGSMMEIFTDLENRTGLNYKTVSCSHHFRAAADGVEPSSIRREYTKTLPYIVKTLGLRYRTVNPPSGHHGGGKRLVFWFNHPEKSRSVLLTSFPGFIHLFAELDKSNRQVPITAR
jgi:hypothetical protein